MNFGEAVDAVFQSHIDSWIAGDCYEYGVVPAHEHTRIPWPEQWVVLIHRQDGAWEYIVNPVLQKFHRTNLENAIKERMPGSKDERSE